VVVVLRRIAVAMPLVLIWAGIVWSMPNAAASPTELLNEAAAMAQARKTGMPVVVSASTDETTLITADPVSGNFVAELSARPARVSDGGGGWRPASARLVQAADGSWRTEAGVAEVMISNGGPAGVVAALNSDSATASVSWPEALPVPVVEDTTATYAEVYPGVDLVVRADLDAVETFLVVKTPAAGKNPKVRDWSMPISTPGLTAKTLDNGVKSLVDGSGTARMLVPPAVMWDSTGKTANLTHAADRLEEVAQTKSAPVGLKIAASKLTASPEDSFLDDPATVYPVVIDPVLQSIDQTHVLRVTDDWSKWDGAVGNEGKIGYNGWTSPYYRSRMFYQFSWPVSGLLPAQISYGEFRYTQVHSVQHSPCLSTSSTYPAVRARLATAISSGDTWADRTGDAWHPQPSVLPVQKIAVGHIDYCKKSAFEVWNLTSALKTERADYASRTTVTVGLYSDDEGNKNGWKYYYNKDGTSPVLRLTYQLTPQVPQSISVSPIRAAAVGSTPATTWSPTPTLSAILKLNTSDACVAQSCLQGEFTVKNSAGVVVASKASYAVANGGNASVAIPGLVDGQTYTVTVRTRSVDTNLYSAFAPPFTFTTDWHPDSPSELKVTDSNGAVANGSPPWVLSSQPGFSVRLPADQICAGTTDACLQASFVVTSGSDVESTMVASGRPGDVVSVIVPSSEALSLGTHTVSVQVKQTVTQQVSGVSSFDFQRLEQPPRPALSGLVHTVGDSAESLVVHLDDAIASGFYTWTMDISDGENTDHIVHTNLQADANGNLTVPWVPRTANAEVSVTVKVFTISDAENNPIYSADSEAQTVTVWMN